MSAMGKVVERASILILEHVFVGCVLGTREYIPNEF